VGRKLQAAGHRVRLATHASMRPLVERHSLEFYPLGGDPHVLAEFAAESRGAHFELSLANCVFSCPSWHRIHARLHAENINQ